ncbi:MAG: hypothetical protein IT441_09275 [Phycisphaeraceae bacterium]|nr:hypothetical protein [Phycisphaeraceae bacterium]
MLNRTRSRWIVGAVALTSALLCLSSSAQTASTTEGSAQAQTPDVAQLWDDFNHYVLVARPELAAAAAEALVKLDQPDVLLDAVEAGRFTDYQGVLARAVKVESLRPAAMALDAYLNKAILARARDPQRLRDAVMRLAQGSRARSRAIEVLREAGQFAAPILLESLRQQEHPELRPYVTGAIVEVGVPLVYPLGESLAGLDAANLSLVAQALAEIGHPRILPYLKALLEDPKTDAGARQIVDVAYRRILARTSAPDQPAARLFLELAYNYASLVERHEAQPGFDAKTHAGIVWEFTPATGLVEVRVPGSIFGDVLAMRAARKALSLDPNLDPALSLWLASNLRRENSLGPDETDPTYREPQPPSYYLSMAGPLRQADVLARALAANNPELALDAIRGLDATAGTSTLAANHDVLQPLLDAMASPDRRVRYEAAFALTKARPEEPFTGSFRVTPVLSEAIRQTSQRHAMVVAPAETLNTLIDLARGLGYDPVGGSSYAAMADEVTALSGIDLIISGLSPADTVSLHKLAGEHYKLSNAPLVIVAQPTDLPELNREFDQVKGVMLTTFDADVQKLQAAVAPQLAAYAGPAMAEDEALKYALTALGLLREVALTRGNVFNVSEAESSLLQCLTDSRAQVVSSSAAVLALIKDAQAQRALADVALDSRLPDELRVALLGSLAQSSEYFGNQLTPGQQDRVLELVRTSKGDLALAAARAHGALTLPTSNLVKMLNQ